MSDLDIVLDFMAKFDDILRPHAVDDELNEWASSNSETYLDTIQNKKCSDKEMDLSLTGYIPFRRQVQREIMDAHRSGNGRMYRDLMIDDSWPVLKRGHRMALAKWMHIGDVRALDREVAKSMARDARQEVREAGKRSYRGTRFFNDAKAYVPYADVSIKQKILRGWLSRGFCNMQSRGIVDAFNVEFGEKPSLNHVEVSVCQLKALGMISV